MPSSDWRPSAGLDALRLRARMLERVRAFFARRGVLEVETPALSAATVTDLHLCSLSTRLGAGDPSRPEDGRRLYLQTSPEFAMKRLLAAGSGPIYQLGRAFRDGEAGRRHNPEFTMLEWYRPGFDHHRLMDEVEELVSEVLEAAPDPSRALSPLRPERLTYRQAFGRYAGVDPLRDPVERLAEAAREAAGGDSSPPDLGDDRDAWLDLLQVTAVQPALATGDGKKRPRAVFLYDYPASQAALARVRPPSRERPGEPPVAERFELFVDGLELANGFHELTDAAEQRRRFEEDLRRRRERGMPEVPVDERLLAALEAGLPECAGVALGFDRLVMVAAGVEEIREVVAFPVGRA